MWVMWLTVLLDMKRLVKNERKKRKKQSKKKKWPQFIVFPFKFALPRMTPFQSEHHRISMEGKRIVGMDVSDNSDGIAPTLTSVACAPMV